MKNTINSMLLLAVVVSIIIAACGEKKVQEEKIKLTDYQNIETTKTLIKQQDAKAVKDYELLIKKANKVLACKPYSVTNKTAVPPSASKHDYMTIGPYWWPNPDTDDGKPYIRKDGEVNPETRNNKTDYTEGERFFNAIKTLNMAYYYSDDKAYAQKAIALIKAWFLDEDTKMNPNLNYGQAIPGLFDGRPFGIIEFSSIKEVLKCLELLEDNKLLDNEIADGMTQWLEAYVNWLQTSKLGKEEANTMNNHGTHYDQQLLSIMLYMGKTEEVKNYLNTITKNRIFSQIEPDGSQPLELARTKSFSYSVMNINGFMHLALLGKKVGVDLWRMESPDGRSLKKAYQYLLPYITNEKKWEYKQIVPMDKSITKVINNLKLVHKEFNDDTFVEVLKSIEK